MMAMNVWRVGTRLMPWFGARCGCRSLTTGTVGGKDVGGKKMEESSGEEEKKKRKKGEGKTTKEVHKVEGVDSAEKVDAKVMIVDVKTNRADEEHAEPPPPPPPPRTQILVVGGNGYVGSAVCQEALKRGLEVASMSRSGRPTTLSAPWMEQVDWIKADALEAGSYNEPLSCSQSVVSCVGAFGSPSYMEKINGQANIQVAKEAAIAGVDRFVFISARRYQLVETAGPMQGYFKGKRAAEKEIQRLFPGKSVILRPSFIYGTKQIGPVKVPLQIIGTPLEMFTSLPPAKLLTRFPILDLVFARPISLEKVAKNAVRAAIGEEVRDILEVEDMM